MSNEEFYKQKLEEMLEKQDSMLKTINFLINKVNEMKDYLEKIGEKE